MASMRDWLKGSETKPGRTVVVHCKAGKGRSGSVVCSYLISEEGWNVRDAMARFTERRMRSSFGEGVSIPSQVRWIGYVDRWAQHQKLYVEREIEILEVHAWGLRDGVKVAVEGFVDEGKTIKTFHTFNKSERISTDDRPEPDTPVVGGTNDIPSKASASSPELTTSPSPTSTTAVIFRPSSPLILPTSDICIDLERRNKATYGWTMVTAVAHVWFNAFFEGRGPENHGDPTSDGVFEISWDAMDGIKGSARKGSRALDRLAVVWRAVSKRKQPPLIITEPREGEKVPESRAADWRQGDGLGPTKDLGLRNASPSSVDISRANSLRSGLGEAREGESESEDGAHGVKTYGPDGEEHVPPPGFGSKQEGYVTDKPQPTGLDGSVESRQDLKNGGGPGMGEMASVVQDMKDVSTDDLEKTKRQRERKGDVSLDFS